MNEIEVTVNIVPTEGTQTSRRVKVQKTGVTTSQILAAAGVDPDRKDLKLNGKPIGLDDHIEGGAQLTLTVTERPRGS